jgi:hypothetical protein
MAFAKYHTAERTVYLRGTVFIVRTERHPRTHYAGGRMVTRQGHTVLIGAGNGFPQLVSADEMATPGFRWDRYALADTMPAER